MKEFMQLIGAVGLIAALFLALPLVGTLFGAFAGWAVGLFFTDTIRQTLTAFGADVTHISMWQIGATLGFVGGFFKSSLTTNKN